MKSLIGSLLHPNQSQSLDLFRRQEFWRSEQRLDSATVTTSSSSSSTDEEPTGWHCKRNPRKSAKMKLFEQPLDKLCSPKAIKHLNQAISQQSSSPYKRRLLSSSSPCLRKLNSAPDANNNLNNKSSISSSQRRRMMLDVLPEPIRNLLNQLYLRGPSTVGIFRKSPNAKHCRELRQRLEADSRSSVEEFHVTVIASVFKEWLRSLPDCLLMSRLYPQWMAVAKLLEPLYQRTNSMLDDSQQTANSSPSPLTDNGQPPDSSCRNSSDANGSNSKSGHLKASVSLPLAPSAFALRERYSECLRIVGQLLDNLNEANLILLRSFICVLWQIARNSEQNKMSATNLGVCVGQSLLNVECSPSNKSSPSSAGTFAKRHRRTRSHSLLSSTLSLGGSSSLDSSSSTSSSSFANSILSKSSHFSQESAKYVPILVAFMIENAPALFGSDIASMLAPPRSLQCNNPATDQVDFETGSSMSEKENCLVANSSVGPKRLEIVVESGANCTSNNRRSINNPLNNHLVVTDPTNGTDTATTSILIVNSPNRRLKQPSSDSDQTRVRPLSATDSTSSSRASSSTSGVSSESPAFSGGETEHCTTGARLERCTNTTTSGAPSSPSSTGSTAATGSPPSSSPLEHQHQESRLGHCSSSGPTHQDKVMGASVGGGASNTATSARQPIRYLFHPQRNSLPPQRSHVMLLRDYYLSLQLEHQRQQQQQQLTYRHQCANFAHRLSVNYPPGASQHHGYAFQAEQQAQQLEQQQQQLLQCRMQQQRIQFNCQQSSQQQQVIAQQQQQQGRFVPNQHHQQFQPPLPALQRPQARMAKIRQNQLANSVQQLYVKQPEGGATLRQLTNGKQVKVNHRLSSGSEREDSADEESDESLHEMESTMV